MTSLRSHFRNSILALSALALVFAPIAGAQELKPDVPKLDTVPEKAPVAPLKGGVEHNTKQAPSKPKKRKLKSAIGSNMMGGQQYGSLDNRRLNSSLDNTALDAQAERSFGVIGVRFVAMTGYPPVINTVFPGTPAAGVGIVPNDVILAVDGVPTVGLTKDECYDLIVGTPNTPVTLSLRRGNNFFSRTMNRVDVNELGDPRVKRAYMYHL